MVPTHCGAGKVPSATALEFKGVIEKPGEVDSYKFTARAGQEFTLAINAAQSKSALDSRLEVVTPDRKPIERIFQHAALLKVHASPSAASM